MDNFITKNTKGRVLLLYIQRLGTGNSYELTEPFGLRSLAAFIEDKDYEAKIFSCSVHNALTLVQREKNLKAIGFYCDYENVSAVESFSSYIKQRQNIRIFVGGPQAVALGEDFLKKSMCDAFVRGDGEYPLYELLEFFLYNKGTIDKISGVSYLKNDKMVTVPPGEPISDLDAIPVRKTDSESTVRENKKNLIILTGRGCPYRCAFCYEGNIAKKVRLRSVANVIKEIETALNYYPGIKYIWFGDDTFTLDIKRIEAFSAELARLRRNYDFMWFCDAHASNIIKYPDMVSMMVEAGLVRMQIGIESGSPTVLKLYRKNTTVEQIEEVVHIVMKQNLPHLAGNIIIGGAGETEKTFEETKEFSERLMRAGPGMVDLTSTLFMPFPCTAITDRPSDFGIKIIDPPGITSMGDLAVIETETLSRERITGMRKEFVSFIREKMKEIFREKAISEERIAQDFHLMAHYGITSNWYKNVYSSDEFLNDRYNLSKDKTFVKLSLKENKEDITCENPDEENLEPEERHERIKAHFLLYEDHGTASQWYEKTLKENPVLFNY
ncbi:MAG: radical SAM protein, partial [Candidatus Eremiobacterota bacterium]